MAKTAVLKVLFRLFVFPLLVLSELAYLTNWRGFRRDARAVISVVDEMADRVPKKLAILLFLAEDHRSELHPGVDPIAIVRASWVWLRWRRLEGGSTVEQQLIRTILCMYERNLSRKLREQLLALAVSRRRTKEGIATTYLAVAYYGTRCVGLGGLKKLCGGNLNKITYKVICGVIARLKYPEPAHPSTIWLVKYHRRVAYIAQREAQLTNHSSAHPYCAAAKSQRVMLLASRRSPVAG